MVGGVDRRQSSSTDARALCVPRSAMAAADRLRVRRLDLPGMDGLALARQLKADPEMCDIHIVAVTCYAEQYPKAAALAAGCDAYLLKPINTRELSDQLTAVVEGGDAVN